jgi:hypothetical protein
LVSLRWSSCSGGGRQCRKSAQLTKIVNSSRPHFTLKKGPTRMTRMAREHRGDDAYRRNRCPSRGA